LNDGKVTTTTSRTKGIVMLSPWINIRKFLYQPLNDGKVTMATSPMKRIIILSLWINTRKFLTPLSDTSSLKGPSLIAGYTIVITEQIRSCNKKTIG